MHRLGFLILTLVLFACTQNVKKEDKKVEKPTEHQLTEINFSEPTFNFGKLDAGEIVLHTFVFTNTGQHNFIIESLHSDCGCITASFTKKVVKPNETGLIEVEFNTAGLAGREYKTIEILGNSKDLKHLVIFAEVKNELIDIKY